MSLFTSTGLPQKDVRFLDECSEFKSDNSKIDNIPLSLRDKMYEVIENACRCHGLAVTRGCMFRMIRVVEEKKIYYGYAFTNGCKYLEDVAKMDMIAEKMRICGNVSTSWLEPNFGTTEFDINQHCEKSPWGKRIMEAAKALEDELISQQDLSPPACGMLSSPPSVSTQKDVECITNTKKTKSGGDLASEWQPKKAKSGDQPHQPSADGPTAEKKWFSVGCAQNDKFYVGPSLERIIKTMSEEIKDKNFNVPTTNSIRLAMSRHKKTSVCLAGIYVQRADILPQGDNVIVIN